MLVAAEKEKKGDNSFFVFEIRRSWFSFFLNKGYFEIPSSPLVPVNDESLLFVNSGVVALKKYFRDSNLLPSRNLVNCQPVIRLSDVEQIDSLNSKHQTMFEMLGSFSVGGNFKKEVIPMIWDWFTSSDWLNIDEKFLFITVWKDDLESYNIWKGLLTFSQNIFLGERETNFWDMGDGPCGPNTEIYYGPITHSSRNLNLDFLPKCIEDLNGENFIEIGNLVFPEFDHQGEEYIVLKEKCVDIGVGLERVAMVKQGKSNVFSIDIWHSIIKEIRKMID